MKARRISMRVGLVASIVVMGYLAMVLAYIGGQVYRGKAVDYQRTALTEQLQLKLDAIQETFAWQARQVVASVMQDQMFLSAFIDHNSAEVSRQLDSQYDHSLVASGALNIKKLYAFTSALKYLAQSRDGGEATAFSPDMCHDLRLQARRRAQKNDPRPVAEYCLWNRYPYFVVVVPIGNWGSAGYIQVVLDPLSNLIAAEKSLKLPLKISLPDEAVLYRSGDWPESGDTKKPLIVDFSLGGERLAGSVTVTAIKELSAFYDEFDNTSYLVMIVAAVITVLTIFIALLVLQKTAIRPLQNLTLQLRNVRADRGQLGRQVREEGNAEVYELAEGFNQMTSELGILYESLEQLAYTDSLTRLPNRTLFHEKVEQAIGTARSSRRAFCVLILDIDRFKEINYTLGHHVGDRVLQQVAQRLEDKVSGGDTVSRLGNNTFGLLLGGIEDRSASDKARTLLTAFGHQFEVDGQSFYLGASIGIACYPAHGTTRNQLVQRADVAMYAAKHAKSGYMQYSPEMDRDNPARLAMMSDLRGAINNKEFTLFYQPKINLDSGYVSGVEALVRWQRTHAVGATPDVFIPILEQTGEIMSLTRWALGEALRQCRAWHQAGIMVQVAVNLSVRDLQESGLATMISTLLADHKVQPRHLELEITESAMMTDPVRCMDTLKHLAAMGVSITIDDFGTGYSSLSYLKRLPARFIKIDKSFVLGMAGDRHDAAIVHSSIDLAHNMGLKVIAEGVENEDQLKLLRKQGCDFAQGYYISRPMPAVDLAEWLKASPWGVAEKV